MTTQDPRSARTIARLRSALREALLDGSLDDLTVSGLCERAGVRRTTFYSHYADVADVLIDTLTAAIDNLLAVPDMTGMSTAQMASEFHETVVAAFEVIEQDRGAFRMAFSSTLASRMRESLEQMLADRLRIALEVWYEHGDVSCVSQRAAVPFSAAGLAATMADWALQEAHDSRAYADAVRDQMPPWWPRSPVV